MQNLIKYPQRQHVVSQRLLGSFLKCNLRKNGIVNVACATKNFTEMSRLCFPVSHSLCIEVHKELYAIRYLLLKNGSSRRYCSPRLLITRNFSTTPYLSNENEAKEQPEGSSKKSDKDPKKPNETQILAIKILLLAFLLLWPLIFVKSIEHDNPWQSDTFVWNDFLHEMLLKGEVEDIIIAGPLIRVNLQEGAIYKGRRLVERSFIVHDPTFAQIIEKKIREVEKSMGISAENGIPIKYIRPNASSAILQVFYFGILFYLLFLLRRRSGSNNFGSKKVQEIFTSMLNNKSAAKYTLVQPDSGKGVRFEDVAGLKEAKIEVMEFVDYLKHPERYNKLGAKVPRGALLLGPPGCGKTLLAKAVATEANVPFLSMNGSEFIEVLGGLGAARVRDLFKQAKARAPCIIYIDEIDALGRKRTQTFGDSESERTLNQLLVEMDGMTSAADVILLASTNRADVLDKALLRPGRFDRHILIDFPTAEERKQIFEYHLKFLSLEGKPAKYSGYLAYLTPGFTGADIANICNEAALHAARNQQRIVTSNDLLYAIDKVIGGVVKTNSTVTPSTKKVVAYHEAGHALVGWLLQHTDALLKVTIIPRTNKRLGFAQYSHLDHKLRSKEELFENICMQLGGRVAESLIFNKISTGAQNDLKTVTKTAYLQVQQFGMSPTVGLLSFNEEMTSSNNKKPYSKKLANLMDAEVRRIIAEAYKTTEKLLLDNKDKLILIAEELLKKETLTYEDVEKLIGPPPFGKKRFVEAAEFTASV